MGREVGLPGDGLRAEECACGINVQCTFPLIRRHVRGVLAAYDAGETDQNVYAAELRGGLLHGCFDFGCIRDVDLYLHYCRVRKVVLQRCDLALRVRGVKVKQREARQTVFEECTGVDEGKSAGTSGYWRVEKDSALTIVELKVS